MASPITVTATNSDGSAGIYLQVEVLTGTGISEIGGAVAAAADAATNTVSFTPNFSGSFIAQALGQASSSATTPVPTTNNTLLTVASGTDAAVDTNGFTAGAQHYSGTVTGGTPVTLGLSNSGITSAFELAAYEISATGIISEDASTPAWAHTSSTNTITTTSFNPPAGAVLVAIIYYNFASSGNPSTTMSVTGGGLVWTAREYSATTSGHNGGAAIFTATVPPAPAIATNFALPGKTWTRKFKHPQRLEISTPQPTPTPDWIQSTSGTLHHGSTLTATFGKPLSSGSKLIAFLSWDAGTGLADFTSLTDGNGNNFTQIATTSYNSGLGAGGLFVLDTPAGDVGTTPTITATFTSSTVDNALVVQEVANLAAGTTASIDGTAATLTGTATGSLQGPPTYSDTSAGEYFVYALLDNGGTTGFAGPGGTYIADPNNVLSVNSSVNIYVKASAGTTETGQFTPGSGSLGWGMFMAAFLPASGGSPVNVTGVTTTANVAGPTGIVTEFIDGTGQVANVSVSGQSDNSLLETLTGTVANVSVAAQNGTLNILEDGTGQVANINVAAIAGTMSSTFTGVVANVNVSGQSDNSVPQSEIGVTANVNAVAPAGAVVTNSGASGPAANVNVSGQSDNSLLETLTGTVGTVSVAAPAASTTDTISGVAGNVNAGSSGSIQIFQKFFPQYSSLPLLPNALKFNPKYIALRVQHNTAKPGVFEPGSVANVAVASTGTVTESQAGAVANVSVSGQSDNSLLEVLSGTTGLVNVVAPAGIVNTGSGTIISGVVANVNVVANPGGGSNTFGGPAATVTVASTGIYADSLAGTVVNVTAVAVAGSINTTLSGSAANVNVATTGLFSEALTGQTATINVASSGSVDKTLQGAVTNISASAISGSILINATAPTGLVNTAAPAGNAGGGSKNITGVTATVNVTVYPGSFELSGFFNPAWWRVYRGYGQSPVW